MASLNDVLSSPLSKGQPPPLPADGPPSPSASPTRTSPRTISELIDRRAQQLPDVPLLGYPSQGTNYSEYTFAQLKDYSLQASRNYVGMLPLRRSSREKAKVVAILGPSTLDYFINVLSLSRLGFTVLFLSTRIAEPAIITLIEGTGCFALIFDPVFERTAKNLAAKLENLKIYSLVEYSIYSSPNAPGEEYLPVDDLIPEQETEKVAWIIHSSGSTGPPKPIYQTHRAALGNYEQGMKMDGFVTLPLFHAHGLSVVFRAITSVNKIYLYNAKLPLSSQNLVNILQRNHFEIFFGVPYALKLLGETAEGIDSLAKLKVVMFGGSACPDSLGDHLVANGVNLVGHFGTTETGQLMTTARKPGDKAWNYVRVNDKVRPYVRFEPRGGDLFELVVLEGWPSKVATNRPDGSYATKDLFEKHPTIEDAWKYSARLDDTIVLMNGEKFIPIAMEQAVRSERFVKESIMFGANKSQLGMFIIPSDSASHMASEELINSVWPAIEKENQAAAAHGQLLREMVRALPCGTSYRQTDKGTIIRQAFYRTYQDEIESVYTNLELNAVGTLALSEAELRAFLRNQISTFVPEQPVDGISDETDLFSIGIDSLQSTRLRATIMQQLKVGGKPLPLNVVFDHPTIAKLAAYLYRVRENQSVETADIANQMEHMVSKHGVFPKTTQKRAKDQATCVVVTGATGSLGAHIVAHLTLRDDIREVCCLVRAGSLQAAHDRVMASMQEREVSEGICGPALRKIVCYPSDLSRPDLGLDPELYDSVCSKATAVIHSAWSVNFNKNLSSFEDDCIAGACNLMALCLSSDKKSPASFNFCSSVSAVANTQDDKVPETVPDFSAAQGMGYAQSKLVTEHLVAKAAQETGMPARVLRIGQVIADTQNGIWNSSEGIPLMLQSATTIGALPTLDESPRWLPVDIVARTVIDISLSSTKQSVFNIVNPRTFHWTKDFLPALHSAGLSFIEVGQVEWIRLLRASNPDPITNPTIKLVDFFASKYDTDAKRRSLEYTTTNAENLSAALREAPVLDEAHVRKFVNRFLSTSWKKIPTENGS